MRKQRPSQTTLSEQQLLKTAQTVSAVTIAGNLLLFIFKLFAGIFAHSHAMISDAIHSASDIFSTIVVMVGIKIASKAPDKEHPYGHERMECVAAVLLAVVLFVTGLSIGRQALTDILDGHYQDLRIPKLLALIAAVVSVIAKEGMYWYTRHYAKKLNSSALMADAWHHRSDAFSSIGALVGIIGARLGFPVMDSVASLIIFGFIAKAAFDILKDAFDKMVDHSGDEETEQQLYDCVRAHEDVLGIDSLHTRIFGNKLYVDIEIEVDGDYTLYRAHQIAEDVHDNIERTFPQVKHIMVHVNPKEPD